MSGLFEMLKMNLKLLIRNKSYLCFLVVLPVMSILVLNIPNTSGYESNGNTSYQIQEIKSIDKQIIKMDNTQLSIKVYDASSSYLSDYILNELAKSGSYKIYRYKAESLNKKEAEKNSVKTFNKNNIGAAIYISDNFKDNVLKNKNGNDIEIYKGADDERITLLKENLNNLTKSVYDYSKLANGDSSKLKSLINESLKKELNRKVIKVNVGNDINLSAKEHSKVTNIGWSLAIIAIVFLFSGVFIASVIVSEKENKVFSRYLVSNMPLSKYVIVKLSLSVITVLVQVIFMGIGIKLFVKSDFGISFSSYMIFVFCLGIIFNLLTVVIGAVINDVLSTNYTAFFIWCLSNLVSGTYFSIENASKLWKRIALLTPQRWIMKCSEMLIAGRNGAISTMILVTFAFVIVILSIGTIGLKVARNE